MFWWCSNMHGVLLLVVNVTDTITVKYSVLTSVSLTRLARNAQEMRESSTANVNLMKAKKDRFEVYIVATKTTAGKHSPRTLR